MARNNTFRNFLMLVRSRIVHAKTVNIWENVALSILISQINFEFSTSSYMVAEQLYIVDTGYV